MTQPAPALVEALQTAGAVVRSVSVGAAHMVALTRDGQVWTWGKAEYGRCGNGPGAQATPQPVEVLAEQRARCLSAAAGGAHSLAALEPGQLWAFGKNESSQLGLGANLVADLHNMEEYPSHVDIEGHEAPLFNGRGRAVAAGLGHSLAITEGGRVWQWGARTFLAPTLVPVAVLSPAARARAPAGAPMDVPLVGERVRFFFFLPAQRRPARRSHSRAALFPPFPPPSPRFR